LIRIDPAWTVKPDARHKLLRQLQEEDVDLLFPSRLTWKFLQKELRANETFYRSQNLCEFVSDEDQIKVTFTDEDLRARLRGLTAFDKSPRVFTILAVDPAFSIARYADFSALAVIRTHQHEDRTIAFVVDVALERMRQSELGVKIVEMIQRHQADRVVIEKTGPWLDLQGHVHNAALVRSAILPHIFWKQNQAGIGGPSVKAKAGRIKGLEVLLAENRLYFAFGVWNDVVFNQFTKFDGVSRSNNTRKDDAPDAIALGCEVFVPRYQSEVKTALQEQADEEMRIQAHLQGQYIHMFGDHQPLTESRYAAPPPDQPDGLHRTLGRFGMVRAA
jgi:hypothetical protein